MDRDAFLAELARRGYPREQVFLLPGPDERRNPEGGGIVVEAPSPRTGGRWRTYKDDRGRRDEAFFDTERDAYAFVLDTHLPPRPVATMATLFEPWPHQWGLRGDPVLWRLLSARLAAESLPPDAEGVRSLVRDGLASILDDAALAAAMTDPRDGSRDDEMAYRDFLDEGGMSRGHVHLGWWRRTGVPLLIGRLPSVVR